MTLDQLQPGQRAEVIRFIGPDSITQRLQTYGLLEGDETRVIDFAPMGDPIEIEVGPSRISLRLSEAKLIEVKTL
jgi:ferrous iron transport protein A